MIWNDDIKTIPCHELLLVAYRDVNGDVVTTAAYAHRTPNNQKIVDLWNDYGIRESNFVAWAKLPLYSSNSNQ